MATVGEAIAATLIAQWNVGTGGIKPDPIQYLVERPERDPNPTVADAIYVWLPLRRTFDPIDVAEVYRNVTYTLRIVCHTKTSSARQLEIENEVDRILNSGTVITGATRQRVKEINDISNRSYSNLPKYISEVIMEVFTAMEVSATAYGTATTTTLTTDELTVNTHITGLGLTITSMLDEDDMASDSAAALVSQQSIKAYVDGETGNETSGAGSTILLPATSCPEGESGTFDVTNGKWTVAANDILHIVLTGKIPNKIHNKAVTIEGITLYYGTPHNDDYITHVYLIRVGTAGGRNIRWQDADDQGNGSTGNTNKAYTGIDETLNASFAYQFEIEAVVGNTSVTVHQIKVVWKY